jgi:hypothetical protein
MRHSSITLTMDTYGHLCPGQEADAVRQLESFMGHVVEQLATTGTDDLAPQVRSATRSAHAAKRCVDGAIPCDESDEPTIVPLAQNPLKSTALCD